MPPVETSGQGVAVLSLNATMDSLCIEIAYNGLSGSLMGAHIHQGAAGTNGDVLIDLTPFIDNGEIRHVLTGEDLTAELLEMHLTNMLYINLHTEQNPGGEIRGQIMLESDFGYYASLSGAQEVPVVETMAMGTGFFNLSKNKEVLKFHVVVDGLSGAIAAAHLHAGAMGENGAVVADLGAFIDGNILTGELNPTDFLTDLEMGEIYINVHTAANPNGEIRGQLMYDTRLAFDVMATGLQEVPAVETPAMASAYFRINEQLNELEYQVQTTQLSGEIVAAHLHMGAPGVNGDVVLDLMEGISGASIIGSVELNDPELLRAALRGEIYLNVHTAANPGGEIRGQLNRTAREAYTLSLDGLQEVPAVETSARGLGMVSIDRDQSNVHFMIVANDLETTMAHFHQGAAGETGGVIFDLTPFLNNNALFGYWTATSDVPFTADDAAAFRTEMVYVNMHTEQFMNGEIRGQALRGYRCSAGVLSAANPTIAMVSANAFPNPTPGPFVLEVSADEATAVEIRLVNTLGQVVLQKSQSLSSGVNRLDLSLENQKSGTYFVQIIGRSDNLVYQIIKQ